MPAACPPKPLPPQLDVVFISDGEDTDMDECKQELGRMKPPQCPSRLFSVGVRSGFPTTLVTDLLYPTFGQDSDASTPAVLPLEDAEEAEWVFEQLRAYVNDASPPPPPSVTDFTEESTMEELSIGAKRAYNACMFGCLFRKSSSDMVALRDCESILTHIAGLSLAALMSSKRAPTRPGLPSRLMVLYGDTTPLDALTLARKLRAQVRQCLERAHKDILLSMLDNDTKRQIAGFASRCGTHALKALRYRSVDFERVKKTLVSALQQYEGHAADAALEDQISGCTQQDVLLDAKSVLPGIQVSVNTTPHLLATLPLIGRTLTIRPVCDGAEMNPWLQVGSAPPPPHSRCADPPPRAGGGGDAVHPQADDDL